MDATLTGLDLLRTALSGPLARVGCDACVAGCVAAWLAAWLAGREWVRGHCRRAGLQQALRHACCAPSPAVIPFENVSGRRVLRLKAEAPQSPETTLKSSVIVSRSVHASAHDRPLIKAHPHARTRPPQQHQQHHQQRLRSEPPAGAKKQASTTRL